MASLIKPAGTYEYNGETKQGYIKDGKTYTDDTYSTEVPVGSKVYTNGGTFIKGSSGGVKTDNTPISATPANGNGVRYTVGGVAKDGYMQNGITYTDKTMAQRVPNGAIVHTAGGTYEMTENGGVPTAQTVINDYKNQSKAYMDAYSAAQKAQEQKIDANVRAAMARLNAQKAEAEQQKKEADRVAYNAYLRATNPYGANAQQMASLGLGGSGFSETNLASLGNEYQANVMQSVLARDAALRDIGLKIEEARLAGDAQKAEALSVYYQTVANMGLNTAQVNASLAQNAANAAYARTRDAIADANYEEEKAYNRQLESLNTAFQLVDKGISPENAAKMLNLSPDVLNALKAYYASRQIAANNAGGGSGGYVDPIIDDDLIIDDLLFPKINGLVSQSPYYGSSVPWAREESPLGVSDNPFLK